MHQHRQPPPPVLDMTPDGRFRTLPPPPPPRWGRRATAPLSTRLLFGSVIVAALAGAATLAALALWIVSMLLPVVVGAALVAYGTLRYRAWRSRQGSLFGGQHRRDGVPLTRHYY